jgi:hypothetical protein
LEVAFLAQVALRQVHVRFAVIVEEDTPVFGDGANGQVRMARSAQLSRQNNIQVRAKRAGQHRAGDDPAARDRQNEWLSQSPALQLSSELQGSVLTVTKHGSLLSSNAASL